jgi:cytochrome c peroxidase
MSLLVHIAKHEDLFPRPRSTRLARDAIRQIRGAVRQPGSCAGLPLSSTWRFSPALSDYPVANRDFPRSSSVQAGFARPGAGHAGARTPRWHAKGKTMKTQLIHDAVTQALAALLLVSAPGYAGGPNRLPPVLDARNASGIAESLSTSGPIDLANPFFQSLGGNGRACVTCHQPSAGWTVTPENVRARFDATGGTDPIFRTNDGSVSPDAGVSSVEARRAAYAMLLTKGLIRVGIGVPANAEFELIAVDDPYGHANASDLSLFRRPLPAANLKFLSTVMWDGRETFKDPASTDCILGTTDCFASIHFDLSDQAAGATTGHAQAPQPTVEVRDAIVAFERSVYTAQIFDDAAGGLSSQGARGGPKTLISQDVYFGINDAVANDYRTGALFDPIVFRLYDSWERGKQAPVGADDVSRIDARAAVFRGQALFNSKPIRITGVGGLNDDLAIPVIDGTCTTCHNTPQAGSHSIPMPLDIGLADASRRTPDLPLYTLRNKQTMQMTKTTDPGRALITGKWQDIGRFKGPILRAVATRAPYFHNGSAPDLPAVVNFYNERFNIGFTEQEQRDLVAFLRTL